MKNSLRLLFALFIMFAVTGVQAQVKFGPKAGVNLSTMTLKSSGLSLDPKMLIGFHAGIISEIGLTENLKLQPGILFSSKGSKYELSLLEQAFELTMSPGVIEVPVNVLYSFGAGTTKLNLFAGPYVAYGFTGKIKSSGESLDISYGSTIDDDMKPLDFGLNIGAGVNINGLLITAQYGLGLANLSPDSSDDTEIKNQVIGISIGYLFGGK
ncbi:MAG: PorT family protein [Bacteroidales bacterium]|nr:PorT family protein [Bacteroidales bacterium]MBK8883061.1 PorT family protein [Bacteroidales bacterium]